MSEENYRYVINSINLKNENSFKPGRINVFVGANNCGKTQLLKDMLSYITGQKNLTIILDDLEVPYPESWIEFAETYEIKMVDNYNNKQIKHISPTLDGDPVGPSAVNEEEFIRILEYRLKNNKLDFRASVGAGMVTYLNTDSRLKLAMSRNVERDLHKRGPKNVLEALYLAGIQATEDVRKYIQSIFGVDVFLDCSNLGTLQYRIGKDFSTIPENPQAAFGELSKYPILDNQGDGIRSVLGMISAIISVKKPIILLDEPEAFLHPPQAFQLGEIISNIVSSSQQIFIATHSADFLRGLLNTTRDAVIVHLDRSEENITQAKVLDSETLNQIITDPLLSSSRVLEGMFYKGVVATEADADAAFYQRIFQKIGASDEIHFVNAHNKQTLKKIIGPYQKLGIRFAMIADADVIRDRHEFSEVLQITSDEGLIKQILQERDTVYSFLQSKDKYETLIQLQKDTLDLASKPLPSKETNSEDVSRILFEFRKNLKKLREDSDELAEFKKKGRGALPDEQREAFDRLWEYCASIGLFIVKVGELESWLIDYEIQRTSNKSKWITQALTKLYEIDYDKDKDIWKFADALREFLIN